MNISVIIPTYNEETNLIFLLPKLHKIIAPLCSEHELIVIDSKKSVDNSEQVCINYNAKYIKQHNYGYADAFRTGIKNSLYEAIIVVDADNSQDISKIPRMYEKLNDGYDVVIGSRYVDGATTSDPISSVIMSKVLNTAYRIFLGFKEKDISTDFRFYRKQLLENIVTTCNNFDVIEETLFLLKYKYPSIKTTEVATNYMPRKEGVSKRKLFKFIIDYVKLLFKLMKYRILRKG